MNQGARALLASVALLWCAQVIGAPDAFTFTVETNGAVVQVRRAPESEPEGRVERIAYQFGLPCTAPERRSLESPRIPISHTAWIENGIRYSQVVLLSRLGPGDLAPEEKLPEDAVLLVRLSGENTASEYRPAKAELAIEAQGAKLKLELKEHLVYANLAGIQRFLGALDIPPGGLARALGDRLEFQGSIPPGISGSMIIKIPVGQLSSEAQITRLQDLDFDEELERAKKFWRARGTQHGAGIFRLRFGEDSR